MCYQIFLGTWGSACVPELCYHFSKISTKSETPLLSSILELSESSQLLLYSLIHTQVNTHTWSEQRLALGGRGRVRLEKVSKVLDSLLQARHLTVDMNNPWKQLSTILNISLVFDWFFTYLCYVFGAQSPEYLITVDRLQSM